MKTSESIKAISTAVMELQNRIPYIGKDSEGYGYRYSSLPEFNKKVYPEMKKLGLSISNAPDNVDGLPALTTLLVHVPTGEFYCSTMPINAAGIKKANDAQQFGASITYMIRYSNKAILGIASDDDDAECLTEKPAPPKRPTHKDIFTADVATLTLGEMGKRFARYVDKLDGKDVEDFRKLHAAKKMDEMAAEITRIENRLNKDGA